MMRAGWSALPGRIACILSLCLFTTVTVGQGQSVVSPIPRALFLHHQAWGAEQGLVPSVVTTLQRSADGYLWVGTLAGLYRFDGVRFTAADERMDPRLRVSVPRQWSALLLDHQGALWIGRSDGALFQYRAGTFVQVLADSSGLHWREAIQSADGVVWLLREQQLMAWRDGHLTPSPFPAEVPSNGIIGIVPDTADGFWMGTLTEGLWHATASGATRVDVPIKKYFNQSGSIRVLHQSADGTLWVWASRLLVRRHGVWSLVTPPGFSSGILAPALAEDRDGTIWIGTRGQGVVRWRNGIFDQIDSRDGLSAPIVNALRSDDEGNIWVATVNGLDRLRTVPFTTLGPRDGLSLESPGVLFEGRGEQFWVKGMGSSPVFRLEGALVAGSTGGIKATAVLGSAWELLSTTSSGGLWLRKGKGLYRYDGPGTVPKHVPLPPGTYPGQIVDAPDGVSWLKLFPRGFGRLRSGRHDPVRYEGDETSVIRVMSGLGGVPWVSLEETPALVQPGVDGVVRRVPLPPEMRAIKAVANVSADTLWGASTGGLVRVIGDRASAVPLRGMTTTWRNYSLAIAVRGDDLWFGSELGLGRFRLADLNAIADGRATSAEPHWFGSLDGLASGSLSGLNLHPAVVARDGRIWFSTVAGIALYDSSFALRSPVPPRVLIEAVTVDDQTAAWTDETELGPNPGRVEIRYTATALRMPERVRIEYQLEGVDRDWVVSGPARLAAYPRLHPGHYRFRVRAWNEDGVASAAEAVLPIRVLPAWYQAWWSWLLAVLGVFGAGAAAVSSTQRARARQDAERMRGRFEAMLEERNRIARELHDTLLQGFTGISLELQALAPAISAKAHEISDSLDNVLKRADHTLREARQMVWDIRAPELDGRDLILALDQAARNTIGGRPIRLEFSVEGETLALSPVLEVALLRIGREAVANAVKHAAPTVITIRLAFEARAVRLTVHDNGLGLDVATLAAAASGGHWGIVGMRERAAALGGRFDVVSEAGRGTEAILRLPVDPGPSC